MQKVYTAALVAWATSVSAFGTINEPIILGQHNEHEMITRAALACPQGEKSDGICFEPRTLDQLAGTHGTIVGQGSNGAVGSPDTLDPVPEGPEAHCDDADYMDVPGYPQSRSQATAQLTKCVKHLRFRFKEGWQDAEDLIDDGEIDPDEVDLEDDCTFALGINIIGRAKCSALEGFGRSLHGVQDFYSHSNWADQANPDLPISDINPLGLGRSTNAGFLDLRATISDISNMVPKDLSTGCFDGLTTDKTPGRGDCKNRVTHNTLNKDHGIIKQSGPVRPTPIFPRTTVRSNFNAAVNAAIRDSSNQWANFRNELVLQYGAEKASLMICAMVRDDPVKDCRNRRLAIVVDSSGSNVWTDPSNLRIEAAKEFNSKLTTNAEAANTLPDKVTVIDFDWTATVIYPMGDPAGASFDSIDSSGGTNIGAGLAAAIDEIMREQEGPKAERSGIVVLTDGEDGSIDYQIQQLQRAESLNIQVNYGFLTTPDDPVIKRGLAKREPDIGIVEAILLTGGVYGTIDSAEAQKNFVKLATGRGLTSVDNCGIPLVLAPGVSASEILKPKDEKKGFLYMASNGENLKFTLVNKTPGSNIKGVLRDVRRNVNLATIDADNSFSLQASGRTDLELIVTSSDTSRSGNIVFSVIMDTDKPLIDPTSSTETTTQTSAAASESTDVTSSELITTTPATSATSDAETTVTTPVTGRNSTVTGRNSTVTGWTTLSLSASRSHSGYASKSRPDRPSTTVITTAYTTICPASVKTTVIDNSDTRVMTIRPIITTTEVQTITLPCPHCAPHTEGYGKGPKPTGYGSKPCKTCGYDDDEDHDYSPLEEEYPAPTKVKAGGCVNGRCSGDESPEKSGGAPEYTGGAPEYTGGAPEYTGGAPEYTGGAPKYTKIPCSGEGCSHHDDSDDSDYSHPSDTPGAYPVPTGSHQCQGPECAKPIVPDEPEHTGEEHYYPPSPTDTPIAVAGASKFLASTAFFGLLVSVAVFYPYF